MKLIKCPTLPVEDLVLQVTNKVLKLINMKEYEQKIDTYGELYLVKKAPFQLPENVKELIVKYGPYVSVVVLLVSLLGLGALFSPLAMLGGVQYGYGNFISIIIAIATLVLSGLSIPGLLKRSISGWRLAWYSALVSAVGALLSRDIFGLVLGLLISMYVLYQIKSYYK